MEETEVMQPEYTDSTAAETDFETAKDDGSTEFEDNAEHGGGYEPEEDDIFLPGDDLSDSKEPSDEKIPEMQFQLRHFDEEISVNEKKVVELAQKGMDYDRIRGKYDQMSAEAGRYRELESFVSELAKDNGLAVDEFMDKTRAQKLIDSELRLGRTMDEDTALSIVKGTRAERTEKSEKLRAREKMYSDFLAKYPNADIGAIPHDIIRKGVECGDLSAVYSEYLMEELKKENEALRREAQNRLRSTGSRSTAGNGRKISSFDRMWYDGT